MHGVQKLLILLLLSIDFPKGKFFKGITTGALWRRSGRRGERRGGGGGGGGGGEGEGGGGM